MVTVRTAQAVDAAGIARVYVDSWRSAYAGILPDDLLIRLNRKSQTQQWARQLGCRRDRQIVLVAELDGQIIGFGSCGPARKAALPHAGEVYTLYVAPGCHDLGIGRKLLHLMFMALRARGITSALVWVLAENPARFFYEAMGGCRVAERDEAAWNTVLHEVAYGWSDLAHVHAGSAVRRAR